MTGAVFWGFLCAFFGAIPVAGPVAAMVVERALHKRFVGAFLIAVGSAIAEGIYAALAVFGFSFLVHKYGWVEPASHLVGGVILIAVGLFFARGHTERKHTPAEGRRDPDSLLGHGLLGFVFTIINPTLLATWGVVTSALYNLGRVQPDPAIAIPFGVAVVLGVTSWFALVVAIIWKIQDRFKPESLDRFIRWIGWGLVVLGGGFAFLFIKYLVGS